MADQNVIRAFLKAINTAKATPREAKALFEAGITESGLRNLSYGDRDSKGALQQRASTGWQHAQDPYRAALDFLAQARQANAQGGSAGQLAQRVQRSAFPGRYDQNSAAAARFLSGAQTGSAGSPGTPGMRTTTSTTSLAPGVDQQRRAALAQFVLAGPKADPLALAQNYAKLGQETQTTTRVTTTPGTPGTAASKGAPAGKGGVAKFGGKPVAGWIEPILAYARAHGWQGSVTSGYRSFADQQRIYNSGVRPAARPGTSNHEFTAYPGGAVDVSNAAQLAQILARSPYAGKLVWAGSKDPVHFSHPRNGSY